MAAVRTSINLHGINYSLIDDLDRAVGVGCWENRDGTVWVQMGHYEQAVIDTIMRNIERYDTKYMITTVDKVLLGMPGTALHKEVEVLNSKCTRMYVQCYGVPRHIVSKELNTYGLLLTTPDKDGVCEVLPITPFKFKKATFTHKK